MYACIHVCQSSLRLCAYGYMTLLRQGCWQIRSCRLLPLTSQKTKTMSQISNRNWRTRRIRYECHTQLFLRINLLYECPLFVQTCGIRLVFGVSTDTQQMSVSMQGAVIQEILTSEEWRRINLALMSNPELIKVICICIFYSVLTRAQPRVHSHATTRMTSFTCKKRMTLTCSSFTPLEK
jgi:hypothetical protein